MGLPADSKFRFRAGILFALKENSDKNGNTYITKKLLIENTCKFLQVDAEQNTNKIDDILQDLSQELVVKQFIEQDEPCVMLSKMYFMEQSIAQKLLALKNNFSGKEIDLSGEIADYELANQIKLHQNQAEAVFTAVNSGVCVITGGPGTGKIMLP